MRPDEDFAMSWEVDGPSSKRLAERSPRRSRKPTTSFSPLTPTARARAISWHVLEVLRQEEGAQGQAGDARCLQRHHQAGSDRGDGRTGARSTPRRWSTPIWRAAHSTIWLAFTLSPLLWRKLPGARSAAMCSRWRCVFRLRPRDRDSSVSSAEHYWQIAALLKTREVKVLRPG